MAAVMKVYRPLHGRTGISWANRIRRLMRNWWHRRGNTLPGRFSANARRSRRFNRRHFVGHKSRSSTFAARSAMGAPPVRRCAHARSIPQQPGSPIRAASCPQDICAACSREMNTAAGLVTRQNRAVAGPIETRSHTRPRVFRPIIHLLDILRFSRVRRATPTQPLPAEPLQAGCRAAYSLRPPLTTAHSAVDREAPSSG